MKQKSQPSSAPYLDTVVAREKKRKRKQKFRWFLVLSLFALTCMGFLIIRYTGNPEAAPLSYQVLSKADVNPDRVRSVFQAGNILIIQANNNPTSADTLHDMTDYYRYSRNQYFAPDSLSRTP